MPYLARSVRVTLSNDLTTLTKTAPSPTTLARLKSGGNMMLDGGQGS
jgi:hypothetical protein